MVFLFFGKAVVAEEPEELGSENTTRQGHCRTCWMNFDLQREFKERKRTSINSYQAWDDSLDTV